jgi:hypothetical protein
MPASSDSGATWWRDAVVYEWDPRRLRAVIDAGLAALEPVGAPATWVLSSHDETRHVTRFGRMKGGAAIMAFDSAAPAADLALGLRRARAAALLTLALPGPADIYQGEELGLPEVDDLPDEALQDPTWERTGRTVRGRDGCRVSLPWEGDHPPYGFTADGVLHLRRRPCTRLPLSWCDAGEAAPRHPAGCHVVLVMRDRRSFVPGAITRVMRGAGAPGYRPGTEATDGARSYGMHHTVMPGFRMDAPA